MRDEEKRESESRSLNEEVVNHFYFYSGFWLLFSFIPHPSAFIPYTSSLPFALTTLTIRSISSLARSVLD